MTARVQVTSELVDVDALKAHPANPRRGDIDAIAKSLQAHGQYRPIVAQRSTGFVIAGNHTLKAAVSLGWKQVAVTWLDVDDETASRILIADNRTSDLASYDDSRLVDLLKSMPELDGTGFDRYDLDQLEGVFSAPTSLGEFSDFEPGATAEPGATSAMQKNREVYVGPYELVVDETTFDEWADGFSGDRKNRAIIADLRTRLGLTPPPPKATTSSTERPTQGVETVAIPDLNPYPGNARQGDIGAISESLRTIGQYRPIVANRRTNRILVGNHTWAAANALGWKEIAVVWVDVDEVAEAKIVLVDNRTSDLAKYDGETLAALLTAMPNLEGTGYTSSDLDDLLQQVHNGQPHRRPAKTSKIKCRIGEWGWSVDREQWNDWETGLRPEIASGEIYDWIAETIGLPDNGWEPKD